MFTSHYGRVWTGSSIPEAVSFGSEFSFPEPAYLGDWMALFHVFLDESGNLMFFVVSHAAGAGGR